MPNKEDNQGKVDIIEAVKRSNVNEKDKQEMIATLEMYNGPIPHPKILEGYDKLDPGAAKRIIDNGIEESNHRRNMEKKTVNHVARSFYFRFALAFILALVFGFGSFYLILQGHTIIGSVFAGVTLISILGIFTGEASNNNNENKENS
ncbi:DUF2335 domain-containing protein [Staphylococcus chromogenes]|uniref:DUF2335 domain-containing protein n=1 Tax=Staphylococcus agnetis TaxID=985762 RepID=A0ABX3Z2J0_9STAP|nr:MULTISPECIES: DUF2335 domain-containing protein [Staphylococcus]ALN76740.1 DUF2335 domain-containing protein [Staphylococcus agnetis]MDG4942799.1 DUF2335 domain-containing protein [Staphylococcus agnetis]OSP20439.1 hypothetical protein B9L42_05660 [Staphylococcus agnetis]OSP25118.1 hypothetical protein B9M87_00765 [Staphylococcus agnetis]OTW31143.1 hypothetical protein B9M88_06695 [Staphylococcus agnetis]